MKGWPFVTVHQVYLDVQLGLMYKQVAIHTPSSQCCSHLPWPDEPAVITFRVNNMEKSFYMIYEWAHIQFIFFAENV